MTDSRKDLLLAPDRDVSPRLDRVRAQVLDLEFRAGRRAFGWWAVAAAWILIAFLKAFTPAVATADPGSAELARAQRLLSSDASQVLALNFEPFQSPRIP